MAIAGGIIAVRILPHTRSRLSAAVGLWMAKRMREMMMNLPDNAPPKLVISILPKLHAQNDQIIAMLREQNELLRQLQQRTSL